jgi:hypothetical protein
MDSLKKELTSLFGAWEKSSTILRSALKGGPYGLLGLYNSVFTNFLDNYDTTSPDFEVKRDLLQSVAVNLTQRIKIEAHMVCVHNLIRLHLK